MSLRLRLTLIYIVLLAIGLAAFGLVVYLIAARSIYEGVDDSLRVRADAVESALQPIRGGLSEEDIALNRSELDNEAAAGVIFEIRSTDARVLYSSLPSASPDLPLPRHVIPNGQRFATRKVQGQRFRLLYRPLYRDGDLVGSIEAGQSLKETDAALDEIRNVSVFGGLAVVLLINVPAYLLAGRALRPVRQVSQLARQVEQTADFSRRLPARRGGGEMAELTATFNAMIERVERTLVAQRAFLADSSHELRRPLTVIRANIDLLNNPALPPEERDACLQEMRTEAEAMSRLLADLLFLSREEAQAIERSLVDVTQLCQQAAARLRAQDANHTLVADLAPGIQVLGDSARLSQMLWNLLENAAQYTPEGGRIELRLTHTNGVARVELRDSGIGISEADLPHVFDRFYRGEAARMARPDGTGLGLAIVRFVAEAHGGRASVRSEPGAGTAFTVELPAAAPPASN